MTVITIFAVLITAIVFFKLGMWLAFSRLNRILKQYMNIHKDNKNIQLGLETALALVNEELDDWI